MSGSRNKQDPARQKRSQHPRRITRKHAVSHHQTRRLTKLDVLILAAIAAVIAFIIYRLFYTLNYKWNWAIIPTYMVRFDAQQQKWVANALLEGFFITIKLSIWGSILALILGSIMGIIATTKSLFFRLISMSYVELIRNCPPLVLIFLFYFFVSDQILPIIEEIYRGCSPNTQQRLAFFTASPELITPFISGVFTLGLFQGAYITEIVRAGIQSIDKTQWETSLAQGFSKIQQMRYIILPQATRIMLPPLASEFINTIKYSSIVSIISIQELTFQGMQIMASTQATIEIWLTITLMYLGLCLSLSLFVQKLEKKLAVTRL